MFINIEIRKTRNTLTTLFWFRYETFINLFEFKVSQQEERETQFLTMLTFRTSSALNSLTQPTRGTFRRPKLVSHRRTPKIDLLRPSLNLNSQFFFKFPSLQSMTSLRPRFYFLSGVFIVTSVIVTFARTRVNTCIQCVKLTNPCTEPKGSQPN